jgi:hypothetical protein
MELDNKKYEILLESVSERFNTIANADNTIDQKSGTLMGFEITVIIGVLTLLIDQLKNVKLLEGLCAIALLIASTVLLIIVSWPKKYFSASVKLTDNQDYLNKDERSLLLQLISDKEKSVDNNSKILKKKTLLFRIATVLLLVGSCLLILSKLNKFYV